MKQSFKTFISLTLALLLVFSPLSSLGYVYAESLEDGDNVTIDVEATPSPGQAELGNGNSDNDGSKTDESGSPEQPQKPEFEEEAEDETGSKKPGEENQGSVPEQSPEAGNEVIPEDKAESKDAARSGPVTMSNGENQDLGSGIFEDVKVEIDGTVIQSDTVHEVDFTDVLMLGVTFSWAIADEVDLKSGDWAELQLPASLSGVSSTVTGPLLDSEDIVVGTYEITSEGKLRVVFNEKLIEKEERKGEVGLLLKFNVTLFEEDIYQKFEFGEEINKNFTLKANQTGEVHAIKKSGVANAQINTKYIDWEIDVNTELAELINASVEDTIPTGLTLDSSSVEIYELIVGSKGKLTEGDQVTNAFTPTTEDGILKVDFGKTTKRIVLNLRQTLKVN